MLLCLFLQTSYIYSWDSAFQFSTVCYLLFVYFIIIKQGRVTVLLFSTSVNLLIGINSCFLSIAEAEPEAAFFPKQKERDKVREEEQLMFVPSSLLLPLVSPPLTLTQYTVHVLYIILSSKSNEITSMLCQHLMFCSLAEQLLMSSMLASP